MTFLQTDKMKLSVLVVAFLLLASAFTFLPAVGAFSPTTVANTGSEPASVVGATATIDYPILAGYSQSVTRTISLANPTGNTPISTFSVTIPVGADKSGVTPSATVYGSPGATITVYGTSPGPWTIVFAGAGSPGDLVPGGATVSFAITFTTEPTYATKAGQADPYSLALAVTDTTGASTILNSITVYECSSTAPTVTGPNGSLTAGTPFNVLVTGEDSGLPLVVTASGNVSDNTHGVSATTTFSPASFTSGPNTGSQSISVNDTTAEGLTVTVSGGTLASTSTGGQLTGSSTLLGIFAGAITSLAVKISNTVGVTTLSYSPTGANKILNITYGWGLTPLLGNGGDTGNITVSTADKYGNPVKSTGTTQVTVTADTYAGQSAGFNTTTATYGHTYPYAPTGGVVPALQLTISAGSSTVVLPDNYFFGVDYGSQSQIVATSTSGLATGVSVMIVTYTLSSTPLTIVAHTLSPKAGSTDAISATLLSSQTQQANVPVNFANTTDTVGIFTNGLTSINVTTTVTTGGAEIANATFTPSTVAGATVSLTAKDNLPGTNAQFTYNTAATPITLTTSGGTVSKLVVLTALSSYAANAGTPPSTYVTSKGALYVAVATADAYGNPATVSAPTQIQLSSTGGLSATLLEIANGYKDTVNSTLAANWPSGLSTSIFTPTTGSTFTITATAVVAGVPLTGTTTVTVVSATPLLSVSGPATLTTGIPSTITGTANASRGIANNKITSITYSINGGAAQGVSFTSAANVAFSFSILLSGNSNVNVTVADSAGDSIWQVVQVPPIPAAKTFTNSTDLKEVTFTGGPDAVQASYTNNGATSLTVIIVANVLNAQGAIILESTATVTIAAGATGTGYPVIQGIAHGTYTVQVTVYSTSYVALSPTTSLTATV